MAAADAAGIYVITDLSVPTLSIITDSPSWTTALYEQYSAVIDNMSKYSNLLGVFAGNEVVTNNTNTAAAAFVKAAVRDTKAYVKSKVSRPLPVGFAAEDDQNTRNNLQSFMACGDASTSIDFYGLNIYSWCGQNTYQGSNYEARTQELATYPVPAIFSEYGCNTAGTRTFEEVQALYGPQMTPVWSGGLVYEWFPDVNNYGLTTQASNGSVPTVEFYNLANQLSQIAPATLDATSYTPNNTALPTCPAVTNAVPNTWQASDTLPPTPQPAVCSCMVSSLSCVATSATAGNPTTVGSQLNYVCGLLSQGGGSCANIGGNGTTGVYGNYSYCAASDQLSYEYNQYYLANKASQGTGACNFANNAQTANPTVSSDSSCTTAASSSGSVPSGVGSGSSSSGTSGSGSSSAASAQGISGNAAVALWTFVGAAMAFGAFAF